MQIYSSINHRALILLFLISFLMFGCSANKRHTKILPPASVPPQFKVLDEYYWWRCQFKIVWPEEQKINWGMDLLLAHAVISPILKEQYKDIAYWRFHRRAARDNAGHQFSFIFYSQPETASAVFRGIQQSEVLQRALEANLIDKVATGDPNKPNSPSIEDASDPNWPLDIQRNWPSFIMGVSSLWLGLIDDSLKDVPDDSADINNLLEKYEKVDAQITTAWRNEGQHAFFHHLNAVFGYNPLLIRKMLSF